MTEFESCTGMGMTGTRRILRESNLLGSGVCRTPAVMETDESRQQRSRRMETNVAGLSWGWKNRTRFLQKWHTLL